VEGDQQGQRAVGLGMREEDGELVAHPLGRDLQELLRRPAGEDDRARIGEPRTLREVSAVSPYVRVTFRTTMTAVL
ncbi:MAG TPA: hypothetical protein VIW69_06230, partial [Candidatus Elarobacter sp.]